MELRVPGKSSEAEVRWAGVPHPNVADLRKQVAFAEDVLYRAYGTHASGPVAIVYVAYSPRGEDREHHPEICMREAAGVAEDTNGRAIVALDAEKRRPAQRFLFRPGPGRHLFMYYWHYTMPPRERGDLSWAQFLHRRMKSSPPSISVQVSTAVPPEQLSAVEKGFLPALDAALQAHVLPEGTAVGCERLPIVLLRR
jgi:hypothetical protein